MTDPHKHDLLHRMPSDLGGLPAEPLAIVDHELAPWEKRVHALLETLALRGVISTEEKRRAVEDLGGTIYKDLTYYEKWVMAASHVLLQKGHITSDELAARLAEVRARFEAVS